jgi:hypothetical protein
MEEGFVDTMLPSRCTTVTRMLLNRLKSCDALEAPLAHTLQRTREGSEWFVHTFHLVKHILDSETANSLLHIPGP